MSATVIYHANCPDGFASAWAAHRALQAAGVQQIDLHEGYYGDSPPWELVDGREVYVVDFSYPRDTLLEMFDRADGLKVYDHHKTAAEALEGLPFCVFDMDRSGAGITWDEMHDGAPRPWLVDYVEDRDLWRFNLPDSREVNDYLMCLPHDLTVWDWAKADGFAGALRAGRGVRMKIDSYCRAMESNVRRVTVEGYRDVPVVNAPQIMISDLLHHLCKLDESTHHHPFAVGFWLRHDGKTQHSLRSLGDFDVSEIAKKYGGGGHRNAAGFQTTERVW